MWLIVFMVAIVLPLIIWGFVTSRNEKSRRYSQGLNAHCRQPKGCLLRYRQTALHITALL